MAKAKTTVKPVPSTPAAAAGAQPWAAGDQTAAAPPADQNPSEAVAKTADAIVDGKAHTPAEVKDALADAPESERIAEVTDQITPIGTDLALARFLGAKDSADPAEAKAAAQELFSSMSDDDRTSVEQHMTAEMLKVIEKVAKGNKARREAANMIDGGKHYGTRVRAATVVTE